MRIDDGRNVKHDGKGVIVLAPTSTPMRSYHATGKSPKEEYLEQWRYKRSLKEEFRL